MSNNYRRGVHQDRDRGPVIPPGGRGRGLRGRGGAQPFVRGGGRGGRHGGGHPGGDEQEWLTTAVWIQANKKTVGEESSSSTPVLHSQSPMLRPGFGRIGQKCMVRTNKFPIEVINDESTMSSKLLLQGVRENIIKENPHAMLLTGSILPECSDMVEGIQVRRGFDLNILPTQMGFCLTVAPRAVLFLKPQLVTSFVEQNMGAKYLTSGLDNDNRLKLSKALCGVSVQTSHTKKYTRNFNVSGISTQAANQIRFDYNNTTMTLTEYFQSRYDCELVYPHLQCIQVESPSSRLIYLPMELCTINTGQKFNGLMSTHLARQFLSLSDLKPTDQGDSINKLKNNRIRDKQKIDEKVEIQIGEMCIVPARILPRAVVIGKSSNFNRPATVERWSCLNLSSGVTDEAMYTFCANLISACRRKGMTFNEDCYIPKIRARPQELEKSLHDIDRKAKNKLQLLLVILPEGDPGAHGKVKKICETELGIVSQCFQPGKITKMKETQKRLYFLHAALKINVKVEGSNFALSDAISKSIPILTDGLLTIVFGADVTHPPKGDVSSLSIAAVVASMDWPGFTYYKGLVSTQEPGVEIIKDLNKMIMELLSSYKKNNRDYPQRIIFFRDGVGDPEFGEVLLWEVSAIREACASLEDGYSPLVTFVVVQKRHKTRFFPVDGEPANKSGNVMPGTVIDTRICHPSDFDFYLCSHSGCMGTSRPMHYQVLLDENKLTADVLQLFINSLCDTLAQKIEAASLVPPVQYAHLAAYRARYYMEGMTTSESRSSSAQGMTGDRQAQISMLPEIHDNVKEVMFYC